MVADRDEFREVLLQQGFPRERAAQSVTGEDLEEALDPHRRAHDRPRFEAQREEDDVRLVVAPTAEFAAVDGRPSDVWDFVPSARCWPGETPGEIPDKLE